MERAWPLRFFWPPPLPPSPARPGGTSPEESFREAQAEARLQRVSLVAQTLRLFGEAAVSAYAGGPGSSEVLEGAAGDASRRAADASLSLLAGASVGSSPLPSWLLIVAAAPLAVLAVLALYQRPIPSLQVVDPLYRVAVRQGPPPSVLQPFLRVLAICLLGLALVAVQLFQPLLFASTGLLLLSLVFGTGTS